MPGAYEHLPALRSDLDRLATLVETAPDLTARAPGLDWTAAQAATHVVVALSGIASGIRGDVSGLRFVTDSAAELGDVSPTVAVAAVNAKSLAMLEITDPAEAADGVRKAGEALVSAVEDAAPEDVCPVPWYGAGSERPASVMAAVSHGEVVVHGLDIARSLGRPWPLVATSAGAISAGVMTGMLPYMVTPKGREFTGVIDVRIRGAAGFSWNFADGEMTVGPAHAGPKVDLRLSMTPEAALLVAYGRASIWAFAATGRIVASGRRPWLALKVTDYFDRP